MPAPKYPNDVQCVAKAMQGMIDDGVTSPEDNQKFNRLVAQVAYQAKDYDKAIDYGNRVIKGGSAPDEAYQSSALLLLQG